MRELVQIKEFNHLDLVNSFLRVENVKFVNLIAYYDVDMYLLIFKIEIHE